MFAITQGSGFQLTLGNGWTVSVQFGSGNYGSNRNAEYDAARKEDFWESRTAEIAAWHGKQSDHRNWYNFGNGDEDEVKGWCSVDEVVEFLGMVSKLPSRKLTASDYEPIETAVAPV
jgi:hypothetical protein